MRQKKWKAVIGLVFAVVLIIVSQTGCSIGKFGKARMTSTRINVPSGLNGNSTEVVVKMLGLPHSKITIQDTEYWAYHNHNGWAIRYHFIVFGKAESEDLILEINNGKVASSYLVDKGLSIGILATPLYVAVPSRLIGFLAKSERWTGVVLT